MYELQMARRKVGGELVYKGDISPLLIYIIYMAVAQWRQMRQMPHF